MDNHSELSGIKQRRGRLTRHAKDFEGKTNGMEDDLADMPQRSISIQNMRNRLAGSSILSTGGTMIEKDALPEFSRSIHQRYGSRVSQGHYGVTEVEVGSINLDSAAAAPGFDTNQ